MDSGCTTTRWPGEEKEATKGLKRRCQHRAGGEGRKCALGKGCPACPSALRQLGDLPPAVHRVLRHSGSLRVERGRHPLRGGCPACPSALRQLEDSPPAVPGVLRHPGSLSTQEGTKATNKARDRGKRGASDAQTDQERGKVARPVKTSCFVSRIAVMPGQKNLAAHMAKGEGNTTHG